MWGSNTRLTLLILVLVGIASSKARADNIPHREIAVFSPSFGSDNGGLSLLGARFRIEHFEATAMILNSSLAFEAGYIYSINPSRWFVPRFILGLSNAFGLSLAPGAGFTFPLIPIAGTYLGIGLDAYLYVYQNGTRVGVTPVIPLNLVLVF